MTPRFSPKRAIAAVALLAVSASFTATFAAQIESSTRAGWRPTSTPTPTPIKLYKGTIKSSPHKLDLATLPREYTDYWVTARILDLEPDEKIVGFRCWIRGGTIVHMGDVPELWSIRIANRLNPAATVRARALKDDAGLESDRYFISFMEIEGKTIPATESPLGWPIQIVLHVIIARTRNGRSSIRTVTFTNKEHAGMVTLRGQGGGGASLLLTPLK